MPYKELRAEDKAEKVRFFRINEVRINGSGVQSEDLKIVQSEGGKKFAQYWFIELVFLNNYSLNLMPNLFQPKIKRFQMKITEQ